MDSFTSGLYMHAWSKNLFRTVCCYMLWLAFGMLLWHHNDAENPPSRNRLEGWESKREGWEYALLWGNSRVEVAPSQICVRKIHYITNTCMCWVIYLGNGLGAVGWLELEQPFWCHPLQDQEPLPISVLILSTSVCVYCVISSILWLKLVFIQCQMVEKSPTHLWLYERMR